MGVFSRQQEAGQRCESIAERHLIDQGLRLVDKNYRCRWGEIDLIFLDSRAQPAELVFVEVRYRKSDQFGGALESISVDKQRKLHRAASHFMQNQPAKWLKSSGASRFDIIAISGSLSSPELDWFVGVLLGV